MSARDIIIENLTIHLRSGWQGDPVYLARQLSEQIQSQALELSSSKQMSISLKGHFAGDPRRVAQHFSGRLTDHKKNRQTGSGG